MTAEPPNLRGQRRRPVEIHGPVVCELVQKATGHQVLAQRQVDIGPQVGPQQPGAPDVADAFGKRSQRAVECRIARTRPAEDVHQQAIDLGDGGLRDVPRIVAQRDDFAQVGHRRTFEIEHDDQRVGSGIEQRKELERHALERRELFRITNQRPVALRVDERHRPATGRDGVVLGGIDETQRRPVPRTRGEQQDQAGPQAGQRFWTNAHVRGIPVTFDAPWRNPYHTRSLVAAPARRRPTGQDPSLAMRTTPCCRFVPPIASGPRGPVSSPPWQRVPAWAAGAAASTPKKITSVEGITEYALDNGLQVLLFPDPSKPTVTINVTYRVGSRHEGRGETGMAHLLEHMVFKGTPTYTNIWGALEDHGASFNGTTWVDRTNYFETLPASDENLEFALHMEADRMVNSIISGEELAKEMTVVRNEFEMGENNPVGILSARMTSAAFLWHNYGKSTIGNRSDIERVPVENLRRFYRNYYQPDNATLVVAGKFDPEKTLGLISKHFGAIPRPKRMLEDTYTEEPVQDGPRLVTLKRVGDVAAAGLVYHIPSGAHPDFAAVQVLQGVLTNRPSGRLYKALIESGRAASVSGSAFSWAEPSIMQFMAEARADQDVHGVLHEMTAAVEGVAGANITDEEVQRIKTQRLKNIKMSMNNSGRIGVRLSEYVALGDWRMFFLHRDRIKAVTTADVRRVAGQYLIEDNRTAGLFIPTPSPTRAPLLTAPAVADMVRDYRGSETVAAGEAFVATPESIEARVQRRTLPSRHPHRAAAQGNTRQRRRREPVVPVRHRSRTPRPHHGPGHDPGDDDAWHEATRLPATARRNRSPAVAHFRRWRRWAARRWWRRSPGCRRRLHRIRS